MGWHITQDAQLDQPTDTKNGTTKAATKATLRREAEDSDTDNSEGGVKLNIQTGAEAEAEDTEDSDGGVELNVQKETERPGGEDRLLTKEMKLPTRHPASRRPASGRPSLQ